MVEREGDAGRSTFDGAPACPILDFLAPSIARVVGARHLRCLRDAAVTITSPSWNSRSSWP